MTKKEDKTQSDEERDATMQACFAEFDSGSITLRTAREVQYQAIRALQVGGKGWEAVDAALRLAYAPQVVTDTNEATG